MGQNIKDFKSWQRVNEDETFLGMLSALAGNVKSAFTGEPVATAPDKEEPAKSEPTAKPKEEEKVVSVTKSKIEDKDYTEKLQDITKKLGNSESIKTVDPDSKIFIALDLTKSNNVDLYAKICQEWIDIRKPLAARVEDPITGRDFAEAAAHVFVKTGSYIPPQLVLAQATLEGGFSKERNKPIDTKNIFNVGNTDDGSTKSFDSKGNPLPGEDPKASWKGGIIAYFNLLATKYLVPGKRTADELVLGEFVNTRGLRYATSKGYEEGLLRLIDDINTRVIA